MKSLRALIAFTLFSGLAFGDFAGTWQGTIHREKDTDARVVVKVPQADSAEVKADLYFVDQGGLNVRANVSIQGSRIKLSGDVGTYEGTLADDGKSISGTFRFVDKSVPLSLVRTTSETEWPIPHPEFEVASIKPAAPDARGMFIRPGPGGGLNVTNMTLKELIVIAYRVQPFQISGGPPWLDSLRYDIVAKPDHKAKNGELMPMLQALLADRFQLIVRRETKELPVYAMVLAKKDGKLGPSLVPAKEGACTPPDPLKPPPPREPGKAPTLFCGQMMMSQRHLSAISAPVTNVIPMLSRMLGRTIVDKTGLTGKYDITLDWTPDEAQGGGGLLAPDGPKTPASSDPSGPSIFTAFQEQLGLKLESQKGPVDVFTVERAEKPSDN